MIKDLPIIAYDNVFGVSDISAPNIKQDVQTVDYTQGESVRPDMIADKYYGSSQLDKLVLDANDIVDPLDFSVASQQKIDQEAIARYGSVEQAQQATIYWENNWKDDDSVITPVFYNSLSPRIKQLYNKVTNYRGQITGYDRKQINNRKTTNQLVVDGVIYKVIQDDELRYYHRVSGYEEIVRQLTTNRQDIKLYAKELVDTQ